MHILQCWLEESGQRRALHMNPLSNEPLSVKYTHGAHAQLFGSTTVPLTPPYTTMLCQ